MENFYALWHLIMFYFQGLFQLTSAILNHEFYNLDQIFSPFLLGQTIMRVVKERFSSTSHRGILYLTLYSMRCFVVNLRLGKLVCGRCSRSGWGGGREGMFKEAVTYGGLGYGEAVRSRVCVFFLCLLGFSGFLPQSKDVQANRRLETDPR